MSNIQIHQLPAGSALTGTGAFPIEDPINSNVTQKFTMTQLIAFLPTGINTIDGDIGSVTGSTINIVTGAGCGQTVSFAGSASTLTFSVTDIDNSNIAVGADAGHSLPGTSDAINNTFFGIETGFNVNAGSQNALFGNNSGGNLTDGSSNVLVGAVSGQNLVDGNLNVCVGYAAGNNLAGADSNNIVIGQGSGVGGDNNKTRIGYNLSNASIQTGCFIDGITGITVTGSAVLVSSTGQLGVAVSSERYKKNITPMGDYSAYIYHLKPVLFSYKLDDTNSTQRGLIAEQVYQVMPELVERNAAGEIETVKYHELSVLLLNELIKQKSVIDNLYARLCVLENTK